MLGKTTHITSCRTWHLCPVYLVAQWQSSLVCWVRQHTEQAEHASPHTDNTRQNHPACSMAYSVTRMLDAGRLATRAARPACIVLVSTLGAARIACTYPHGCVCLYLCVCVRAAVSLMGPGLLYSKLFYRAVNVPTYAEPYLKKTKTVNKVLQLAFLLPVAAMLSQVRTDPGRPCLVSGKGLMLCSLAMYLLPCMRVAQAHLVLGVMCHACACNSMRESAWVFRWSHMRTTSAWCFMCVQFLPLSCHWGMDRSQAELVLIVLLVGVAVTHYMIITPLSQVCDTHTHTHMYTHTNRHIDTHTHTRTRCSLPRGAVSLPLPCHVDVRVRVCVCVCPRRHTHRFLN